VKDIKIKIARGISSTGTPSTRNEERGCIVGRGRDEERAKAEQQDGDKEREDEDASEDEDEGDDDVDEIRQVVGGRASRRKAASFVEQGVSWAG